MRMTFIACLLAITTLCACTVEQAGSGDSKEVSTKPMPEIRYYVLADS